MKKVTATLEGVSPLMWGRKVAEKKSDDETHDDFDARMWRDRFHADKDGLFGPGRAGKLALVHAAKQAGTKVPGRGSKQFAGLYKGGLMVETIRIKHGKRNAKPSDLREVVEFVPPDGKSGGSSRVPRHFPRLEAWGAVIEITIIDDTLSGYVDTMRKHLENAGLLSGLGMWRPEKGGDYGRFRVVDWKVEEIEA